jgi:hypothetical protein
VVTRNAIWHRIFAAMSDDADFEYLIIDSTIVLAHQLAARAALAPGAEATATCHKVTTERGQISAHPHWQPPVGD